MPLALRRIPNPPGTRPCCSMPYYPCPDVDTELHSDSSETNFYVVERGFVVGTYTDPKIATKQVEGYRDGYRIKVPRYEDAVVQWEAMCAANHGFICPVAAAESRTLPPRAILSTAASLTHTSSFGAAQRKFVDAAVSGKPTPPLPGVQGTPNPPPASSKPAGAAYANSGATHPHASGSFQGQPTASSSKLGSGAAAFSQMGQGPPVEVHWGVKGVYRTYPSHRDAQIVAQKLGISENDIVGDRDPAFVEAWVKRP
ncbi:hypothetical protein C8F04DRAFT_1270016 [Mycena alexandri]|uniref:Uncharacterized protein n=1 Tax=Mycena alexandri TaxID=1745969 RepID=A0AAD6SDL4_9AGAR|nr:hypothetical protein C8F04DRAFT_1270016 [Mycena alexandri]